METADALRYAGSTGKLITSASSQHRGITVLVHHEEDLNWDTDHVRHAPSARSIDTQRIFDIVLAVLLLPLVVPACVIFGAGVLIFDGRPILHLSERMKAPGERFCLYKLRSMRVGTRGKGVLGGDRLHQVTRFGQFLRRSRMDELPQIFNILKGDMSFVGPRPPEPMYVERCPDLYARVLRCRPGVTGLATLVFHPREEGLLRKCRTPEETDRVYMKVCVPRKARLDLMWQRKRSVRGDLWIIWRTITRVLKRGLGRKA